MYKRQTMSGIENCNNTSTKIFLNDGVEIMPCITTNANYMQFYIDINGNKKPNVVGKDVFAFEYGLKTDNSLYKKLFPRFNYDTVAVSYTHLDVYKRQDEIPHKIPSSFANNLAVFIASSSFTGTILSTTFLSKFLGTKFAPIP